MFVVCLVGLSQISENINSILKLNGSNFKIWKESLEILLGCMDLDLALKTDKPLLRNSRIRLTLRSGNGEIAWVWWQLDTPF